MDKKSELTAYFLHKVEPIADIKSLENSMCLQFLLKINKINNF